MYCIGIEEDCIVWLIQEMTNNNNNNDNNNNNNNNNNNKNNNSSPRPGNTGDTGRIVSSHGERHPL